MIRTMFDTDVLADLDQPCHILATYSDLVPDASGIPFDATGRTLVFIDRGLGDPGGKATIWDVEGGALRVDQLPAKYDAAAARGLRYLTVYSDRSHLDAIDAVMGDRNYWSWVATLDGTLHVAGRPPLRGPAAVQFAGSQAVGLHGDMSLVFNDRWNPTHAMGRAKKLNDDVDAALHSLISKLNSATTSTHFLAERLSQIER